MREQVLYLARLELDRLGGNATAVDVRRQPAVPTEEPYLLSDNGARRGRDVRTILLHHFLSVRNSAAAPIALAYRPSGPGRAGRASRTMISTRDSPCHQLRSTP